jgi:formate/nitrite transporter FocA (FNT family)
LADAQPDVHPEYLQAAYVPERLAQEGRELLGCTLGRMVVLALLGGAFVTFGALLSIVIGAGITAEGPSRLVEGFGFSAGYYFIALAGVALFTEANIALPDVLLDKDKPHRHLLRFWTATFVFNFLGAFVVGWMVHLGQDYSPEVQSTLSEIVDAKMAYRERGGIGAWAAIVLSGALATWMVGLAFFFATMAQSVVGKFLPLALAVILFEAATSSTVPPTWPTSASSCRRATGRAGGTRSRGTSPQPPLATSSAVHCWSPCRSGTRSALGHDRKTTTADRRSTQTGPAGPATTPPR